MEATLNSLVSSLKSGSPLAYAISFFAGVLVSFTPCVYPLVPINVGFIAGRSPGSRLKAFYLSLSFVLGTAVVYTLLGIVASLTGRIFGRLQTNPFTFFFIGSLSLLLGLSLLGLFDLPALRLFSPSRFKVRPANSKFDILGAFALGAAGGLIVGPCTAPVLGTLLLYVALKENALFGATLIFVFALGMGTILILTGTFSQLLINLPRAGKWNLRVKKALGWLLIIYAAFLFFRGGRLML